MRLMVAVFFMSSLVVGCEVNSSGTKLQYMPDMADAPTVKAQEDYIDPPEHSVAMNGQIYPKTAEEAEKVLKNPYPPSDVVVKEGEKLFNTVCIACHGADGKGDHALGPTFIRPPDITDVKYVSRGDGFFFHRITAGFGNMPGYAHSTSVSERWKIVHYLRNLQVANKGK